MASSRCTSTGLGSNYTLVSGESVRIDSITVANNTAAPVVVNVKYADNSGTYCTLVVPAFETVGQTVSFIADKGVYVPLVDAAVYITFVHSAGSA